MTLLSTTRRLLFWILSLGVALASWRFLIGGVAATMEHIAYHADLRPIALYAHIGLAPLALALMPVQLWPGLRARRPRLHRWSGRVAGLAMVVSGVGGLVIALGTRAGPVASMGFAVLAVLWVGATIWGIRAAMVGRIAEHRRWMIRASALTFAAVTLRLYLPLLAMTVGFEIGYPAVAWLCWVPNLLIAEWWLRRRPSGQARPQPLAA